MSIKKEVKPLEKKSLRTKFFVNSPAQFSFLFLLLVSILVPVLFVGGLVYFLIFTILAYQQTVPDSIGVNIYPIITKTNIAIILGFIPLFLLIFAWGVTLTHRFAGPLERLRGEIDNAVAKDDFKSRLSVRKRDYVKPLVDSINRLLDKINTMKTSS